MQNLKYILLTSFISFLLISCNQRESRFTELKPGSTGVDFINQLSPSSDLNIFNYLYFYNGGGVAAGDLNGDGFSDLVFVGNQVNDKVYLNQGNLVFSDISEILNQKERNNKWSTGVSLADINGDGKLDIYISEVGSYLKIEGQNRLYINQGNDADGIPHFQEMAKQVGLDIVGFGTQAAFFDYDLDGDLDAYILNHSVHSNGTFGRSEIRSESHPLAGDRFLRNDEGIFSDITTESGIYNSPLGYGLGIGISDIDKNGYPDIYVGNDFHEDDYLYLNQGDGTFKESLSDMIRHTSRFSMGNDISDVNNDGLVDILSLDMLPREYQKLKSSAGEEPYDVYQYKLKYGYSDQFARNTLQLNKGNNKFSEVGMLSGIAATDWSWSGLMADFDLDGYNDLFIANGIKGRTNDLDYINFISNEAIQNRLQGDMTEEELLLTEKMPIVKIPNYAFKNKGNITFEDVSSEWGLSQDTFSNGAVYADLDNDGDLEIIINNIDQAASIYKNNSVENKHGNFLTIRFEGPGTNTFGVGANVTIPVSDSVTIFKELYPVRGFQSTVPHKLYFGLDSLNTVDFTVKWPDGKSQTLSGVATNQEIVVDYSDAAVSNETENKLQIQIASKIEDDLGVSFVHKENDFVEFHRESLIPHMISAEGPAFARGDINGDNRHDFFLGGAKRNPSYYYIQQADGTFYETVLQEDSVYEDVDAVFSDFDKDGNQDLLVVSGGNEYRGKSPYNQPRLYLNDGEGNLVRNVSWIPEVYLNGSVVRVSDYDKDGDVDLFIGARSLQWKYGMDPTSYLLRNEGDKFVIDESFSNIGEGLGMVTDAAWADLENNGSWDLIITSEWQNIRLVRNTSTGWELQEIPETSNLWYSLTIHDLDRSGYVDFVAGGLGMNSKLSGYESVNLYVSDFDENGSVEQIMTYIEDGKEYLFSEKDELTGQLNYIKKSFTDYESFSRASFEQVFSQELISKAKKLTITDTRSSAFYQQSDGTFKRVPLPEQAQVAPLRTLFLGDFNLDGESDILGAGNMFRVNIQRGKYDASYGEMMLNWGIKGLRYVENSFHKLYLEGEIVHIDYLVIKGKPCLIVLKNNDAPDFYEINLMGNPL